MNTSFNTENVHRRIMAPNSITHFISSAKDLSDLIYIETYFEKHPLTPLSLEKSVIIHLQRLFDTILNTPVPNNDHIRGLLGIMKCLQQFSLCQDDSVWHSSCDAFVKLVLMCTRFIILHLDEENIQFHDILEYILNSIVNSSRNHVAVKNKMLLNISSSIFDVVVEKTLPLNVQRKCIQTLNSIVRRSAQEIRKIAMERVYPKLVKFFDKIYTCGDFDTQVTIVETILRFIVPDKNRNLFYVHFKHKNPDVLRQFLNVQCKNFDVDCRIFLNYINRSQRNNSLVLSVPCCRVLIDKKSVQKPMEQDLFWVDFNKGAPSVSLWCSKISFLTPEECNEPSFKSLTDWQLMIIKPGVVSEVKIENRLCNETRKYFKLIQFFTKGKLEIEPLQDIKQINAKCISILFPNSSETDNIEEKVLPSMFQMQTLDLRKKRKVSHSEKFHFVGLNCSDRDSKNTFNAERKSHHTPHEKRSDFSSSENNLIQNTNGLKTQTMKQSCTHRIKSQVNETSAEWKNKTPIKQRKVSFTKTKIEFQYCFASDDEKEKCSENTIHNISSVRSKRKLTTNEDKEIQNCKIVGSAANKMHLEEKNKLPRKQLKVSFPVNIQKPYALEKKDLKVKKTLKVSSSSGKCQFFRSDRKEENVSLHRSNQTKAISDPKNNLNCANVPNKTDASASSDLIRKKSRNVVLSSSEMVNLQETNKKKIGASSSRGQTTTKEQIKNRNKEKQENNSKHIINCLDSDIQTNPIPLENFVLQQNLNMHIKKLVQEDNVIRSNNKEGQVCKGFAMDKVIKRKQIPLANEIIPEEGCDMQAEAELNAHSLQIENKEKRNVLLNKEAKCIGKPKKISSVSTSLLFDNNSKQQLRIMNSEVHNIDKKREVRESYFSENSSFKGDVQTNINAMQESNNERELLSLAKNTVKTPSGNNSYMSTLDCESNHQTQHLTLQNVETFSETCKNRKELKASSASRKQSHQVVTHFTRSKKDVDLSIAHKKERTTILCLDDNESKNCRSRSVKIQNAKEKCRDDFGTNVLEENITKDRSEKEIVLEANNENYEYTKLCENTLTALGMSKQNTSTEKIRKQRQKYVNKTCNKQNEITDSSSKLENELQTNSKTEEVVKHNFKEKNYKRNERSFEDVEENATSKYKPMTKGDNKLVDQSCNSKQFVTRDGSIMKHKIHNSPSIGRISNVNLRNTTKYENIKQCRKGTKDLHNETRNQKTSKESFNKVFKTYSKSKSKFFNEEEVKEGREWEENKEYGLEENHTSKTDVLQKKRGSFAINKDTFEAKEMNKQLLSESQEKAQINDISRIPENVCIEDDSNQSSKVLKGKITDSHLRGNTHQTCNENNFGERETTHISPYSPQNVSHFVTTAMVHRSSKILFPKKNRNVDTEPTQSTKVLNSYSRNVTSSSAGNNISNVENKIRNKSTVNSSSIKDNTKERFVQVTVTNKLESSEPHKVAKEVSECCEGDQEDTKLGENSLKLMHPVDNTSNEMKQRKISKNSKRYSTINESNEKKLLNSQQRSLRKRKKISYVYDSPPTELDSSQENESKSNINNKCISNNKKQRLSLKKKLFTQNNDDYVTICSGSQSSCVVENNDNHNHEQRVKITKNEGSTMNEDSKSIKGSTKCKSSAKSKGFTKIEECEKSEDFDKILRKKINDGFEQFLATSPPPLPKRNPNHWKEKYMREVLSHSKNTSKKNETAHSAKRKQSVYSDFESNSDSAVPSENEVDQGTFRDASVNKSKTSGSKVDTTIQRTNQVNTDSVKNTSKKNEIVSSTKRKQSIYSDFENNSDSAVPSENEVEQRTFRHTSVNKSKTSGSKVDTTIQRTNQVNTDSVKNTSKKNEIVSSTKRKQSIYSDFENNSDSAVPSENEVEQRTFRHTSVNKSKTSGSKVDTTIQQTNQVNTDSVKNTSKKNEIAHSAKRKQSTYSHFESDSDSEVPLENGVEQGTFKDTSVNESKTSDFNDNTIVQRKHEDNSKILKENNDAKEMYEYDKRDKRQNYKVTSVPSNQMETPRVEQSFSIQNQNNDHEITKKHDNLNKNCTSELQSNFKPISEVILSPFKGFTEKIFQKACQKHDKVKFFGKQREEDGIFQQGLTMQRVNNITSIQEETYDSLDIESACNVESSIRNKNETLYKNKNSDNEISNSKSKADNLTNCKRSNHMNENCFEYPDTNMESNSSEYGSKTIKMNDKKSNNSTIVETKTYYSTYNEHEVNNPLLDDSCSFEAETNRQQNTTMKCNSTQIEIMGKSKCIEEIQKLDTHNPCNRSNLESSVSNCYEKRIQNYKGKERNPRRVIETGVMVSNSRETGIISIVTTSQNERVNHQLQKEIVPNMDLSSSSTEDEEGQTHNLSPSSAAPAGSFIDDNSSEKKTGTLQAMEDTSILSTSMKETPFMSSAFKSEIQKFVSEKFNRIKEVSNNFSSSVLNNFSNITSSYINKRSTARKEFDENVSDYVHKIRNGIQELDNYVEVLEKTQEQMKEAMVNKGCVVNEIQQTISCLEDACEQYSSIASSKPQYDLHKLASVLDERYRKETMKNMLKEIHNVHNISL